MLFNILNILNKVSRYLLMQFWHGHTVTYLLILNGSLNNLHLVTSSRSGSTCCLLTQKIHLKHQTLDSYCLRMPITDIPSTHQYDFAQTSSTPTSMTGTVVSEVAVRQRVLCSQKVVSLTPSFPTTSMCPQVRGLNSELLTDLCTKRQAGGMWHGVKVLWVVGMTRKVHHPCPLSPYTDAWMGNESTSHGTSSTIITHSVQNHPEEKPHRASAHPQYRSLLSFFYCLIFFKANMGLVVLLRFSLGAFKRTAWFVLVEVYFELLFF